MRVVAYMGHPLGEVRDDVYDNQRRNNLSNGLDWVRFLTAATSWAVSYPSFVFLAADDRSSAAPRALVDQLEILSRCDAYVLVGGTMNPHMRIEMRHATGRIGGPIPVIDLLYMGRVPPWDRMDGAFREIRRLADVAGIEV